MPLRFGTALPMGMHKKHQTCHMLLALQHWARPATTPPSQQSTASHVPQPSRTRKPTTTRGTLTEQS
eukprot:48135-Chlamydomonas_euryale.AAC.2